MNITTAARRFLANALLYAAASAVTGCAGSSPRTESATRVATVDPSRGHTERDFLEAIRRVPGVSAGSSQVLLVLGDDSAPADQARFVAIAMYESAGSGQPFRRVLGPFPGAIGFKGFAKVGEKREGDRKSPTGRFTITELFGEDPRFQIRMPYKLLAPDDLWCEDPASPYYNSWIKVPSSPMASDAGQAARDNLFWHGAVIDYNRTPVVPGAGSGIFMHKAEPDGAGTYGCVGLDAADLDAVLLRLDPVRKPEIIMGTSQELRRLGGR